MRPAILVFIALSLASCKHTVIVDPVFPENQYFIFGDYYGECGGDCVHLYKLEGGMLYKDRAMKYMNMEGSSNAEFVAVADSLYQRAKEIQSEVPAKLYS